jgi:hypothetical protein
MNLISKRAIRLPTDNPRGRARFATRLAIAALLFAACQNHRMRAQNSAGQSPAADTTEQKIAKLTDALTRAQAQMETYQQQLQELQQELSALRQQMALEKATTAIANTASASAPTPAPASPQASPILDELQERQAIVESQVATHETSKVETQSKFPLRVTGLLLFNGFVNTRQVDISASPDYALTGPGSTGLSIRQTVLGLDARGPHLMGAASRADLRVDFFANGVQSNYAASGVLRLRTAHATLDWPDTEAFFALDRSILEPNEPSSLVAIAQPELAWAGNLWSWSPQIGLSRQFMLSDASRIKAQAALIDTSDPQLPVVPASTSPLTQTERSRWPGTEARLSFLHGESALRSEIGVGGYYSPHRDASGDRFNAWAATADVLLPVTKYFNITANAYRGQALGGLGGGGYVNFYYENFGANQVAQALDDIGGWTQLQARVNPRLQFNTGYGIDNPFAAEVHEANAAITGSYYQGLARNRSIYSNAIYSPNAYLLFSLEYRRFWTNYAAGATYASDVIGIGAGYKF